jgi:hypothetical protein
MIAQTPAATSTPNRKKSAKANCAKYNILHVCFYLISANSKNLKSKINEMNKYIDSHFMNNYKCPITAICLFVKRILIFIIFDR